MMDKLIDLDAGLYLKLRQKCILQRKPVFEVLNDMLRESLEEPVFDEKPDIQRCRVRLNDQQAVEINLIALKAKTTVKKLIEGWLNDKLRTEFEEDPILG